MQSKTFSLALLLFFFACNNSASSLQYHISKDTRPGEENPYSSIKMIPLPNGFKRLPSTEGSFSHWLRNVGLKKDKKVYKYDGTLKTNQQAQFAVLDISVGNRDLQQCADAIMRLKAEYLFEQQKFDEINFYDNDGKGYPFEKPYTRGNLDNYLQRVFGTCGSASLSKQLHAVKNFTDISAGDVLIRGGFPGHAVIVMDVAIDSNGVKAYLLAQSYMPAQDIHLLINPSDNSFSPWYKVNHDPVIETPEYSFRRNELKRW